MSLYKFITQVLFILKISRLNAQTTAAPHNTTTGCLSGPSTWYVGTQNQTYSGIPCQPWNSNVPHVPRREPRDGTNHNYCRNPDNDPAGTWCYTMNPRIRWQFCRIPKCPDPSLLLMTVNGRGNGRLQQAFADVELSFPVWNAETLYNQTGSQFWAVAADKRQERAFFIDIRTKYLGIFSFATNTTIKRLPGMMGDVEQLAYDWVTGNLYWNDYKKKAIMAVEKTFRYYTILYQNSEQSFFGLALHAKRRLLFFTTTDAAGMTKIRSTDLAGKNMTTLYPNRATRPSTIRCIAVDYTDDKLYWSVEFPGFVTLIMSANVDGSNITQIFTSTRRAIWGIAAYLDYIYLADHTQYFSGTTGTTSYRLRVITKAGAQFRSLKHRSRVRALAVYSDREEASPGDDNISPNVNCSVSPACEQICLPRLHARRECACLPGYVLSGETKCIVKTLRDDYMTLFDNTQQQAFQVSMAPNKAEVFAIPRDAAYNIGAMEVNQITGTIYFFDRNTSTIYRTEHNSSKVMSIRNGVHAISIKVDPIFQNIYFADDDTQTINVMNENGEYLKILSSPPRNSSDDSKTIKAMALDLANKHVYWLTRGGSRKLGQLKRIAMDGGNETVILDQIRNPTYFMIDDKRRSIFMSYHTRNENSEIIYEISLSSLQNRVRSPIPRGSTRYRIGFSFMSNRQITEFVIINNFFYLATTPSDGLQIVNMTEAANQDASARSIAEPNVFYNPRYMSLFTTNKSSFYRSLGNGCKNRKKSCDQLCFPTPRNTSACGCQNGYNLMLETRCRNSSDRLDLAPSYGNTCPQDFEISYEYCSAAPRLNTWTPPKWTDDFTPSTSLIVTKPHFLSNYLEGRYTFVYSARDEDGNTGYCSFTVTVNAIRCPKVQLPSSLPFKAKNEYCKDSILLYELHCKNLNKNIKYGNFTAASLVNSCEDNIQFRITNFSELSCVDPVDPNPPNLATSKVNHLTTGAVVAIVIVIVVIIALVVIIAVIAMRNYKRNGRFFLNTDGTPIFSWKKYSDKEDHENIYHHI